MRYDGGTKNNKQATQTSKNLTLLLWKVIETSYYYSLSRLLNPGSLSEKSLVFFYFLLQCSENSQLKIWCLRNEGKSSNFRHGVPLAQSHVVTLTESSESSRRWDTEPPLGVQICVCANKRLSSLIGLVEHLSMSKLWAPKMTNICHPSSFCPHQDLAEPPCWNHADSLKRNGRI